ncbi:MAG: hypothetical protein K6F58_02275 [Bacteroidales bacterium]|nr:hypothetical protein [Bacteroidales bacterium]
MIERMTKYSFVLLSQQKEEFLSRLQELGVVDITRSEKPVDEHSAALLAEAERLRKEIADISAGSDAHLKDLENELKTLLKERDENAVWGSWNRGLLAETGLDLHFYMTDARRFDPSWPEQFAIQKVAEEDGRVWFVIVGGNEGFPLKELPAPALTYAEASEAIDDKQNETALYAKALKDRAEELPALRKALAAKREELSVYLAGLSGENAAADALVVFEGFVPDEQTAGFEASLEDLPAVWFKDAATVEDKPPVKFRNNKFVGQFEVLTDMYGRPAYDGFDPTPFISIFFTLFFAFCMGDAGYGLVLLLLGFLLKGALGRQTSALVVTLGIATFVIGFFFHSFFSLDISRWEFIQNLGLNRIMVPSDSQFVVPGMGAYDWNMVIALICGVVHISLAQFTKACVETRNKGFLGSLGTWGWTLLIVGGVAVGAFGLLGVLDSNITKTAIIIVGIISALCIFILRDLNKNPLANFGNGLWETYNTATGLLSDVLSYLRLYALGLAGGLLGGAFNDLAVMVRGDGGLGWVWFAALLVIGHVLNIAMCALSAFVHPLRLNFLEFFKNSGYEGTGRKYNPLSKDNSNNQNQ